jgi:hypothetical protein
MSSKVKAYMGAFAAATASKKVACVITPLDVPLPAGASVMFYVSRTVNNILHEAQVCIVSVETIEKMGYPELVAEQVALELANRL